jgi:Cd2+/Zn2+-exporting ATPase
MGEAGSAVAAAAADVILLSNNLLRLPHAVELSRRTRIVVFENCFLAIATKMVAMALAIFIELPFWEAALIDIGTLLLVISNGTRILSMNTFPSDSSSALTTGDQ